MNGQSARKSEAVCLRAWGERACFTRPEMKVERVSYDVMTPSAARGGDTPLAASTQPAADSGAAPAGSPTSRPNLAQTFGAAVSDYSDRAAPLLPAGLVAGMGLLAFVRARRSTKKKNGR